MAGLNRRGFVAVAGAGALLGAAGCSSNASHSGATLFLHGVASGDPLQHAVVIWTRLSGSEEAATVEWLVARDRKLRHIVRRGTVVASPEHDFCCKIDVDQLESGHDYFYAFRANGAQSTVGHTRTLAEAYLAQARLAVVSCAHYQQGRYAAYARIAAQRDLDAVIHLGDYIYEYGDISGGTIAIDPAHEIVSLEDYRRRYAFYRSDPSLQSCHASHPFIAVWDDHETANNSWSGGARNHDPASEGRWEARRAVAVRAWHEWMPVRDAGTSEFIHRAFRFGDLADLVMLDTRIEARDEPARSARRIADTPERQMLGATQEQWLFEQLDASMARGSRWRLIGQQVIFSPLGNFNPDQWDGYPQARERVLAHIVQAGIRDVVILTGDIHSSWALDVVPDPYDPEAYDGSTGEGALAVEFVTSGVSSEPLGAYLRQRDPQRLKKVIDGISNQPHLRYSDLESRGFMTLDVRRDVVEARWHVVEHPDDSGSRALLARTESVRRGDNHL
ncbi:MAG: alkaline phosphatase D family protein, partial [Pseudomonadales bacterium]